MRFNIKIFDAMMNHRFQKHIIHFSLGLLFCLQVLEVRAQNTEKRSSNHDLRSRQVIFSVKGKSERLSLESSGSGEFSLSKYEGDDLIKVWKVDRAVALTMDADFADKFIRLKYEMKAHSGKSCRSIFALSMRGEEQEVCDGEKEKKDIIEQLIGEIKKKFS